MSVLEKEKREKEKLKKKIRTYIRVDIRTFLCRCNPCDFLLCLWVKTKKLIILALQAGEETDRVTH